MGLRQRERIDRNTTEEQTCEACGASMLDTWSRHVRVGGVRLNLCSTCQGEARDGPKALKAYVRCRAYWGDDVNNDILNKL